MGYGVSFQSGQQGGVNFVIAPVASPAPPGPTALSLVQRISLNLRLAQRLLVKNGKGQVVSAIGLKAHAELASPRGCKICERIAEPQVRIDWHEDLHKNPDDFIAFCPGLAADAMLQRLVYRAIQIEDMGGLDRYTGRPLALLPGSTVDFYLACLAARDRLLAEHTHAQANAARRK